MLNYVYIIVVIVIIDVSGNDVKIDNMCKKTTTSVEESLEVVVMTYSDTVVEWCSLMRCTKVETKTKTGMQKKMIHKTSIVYDCCDGYRKDRYTNICKPICNPSCGKFGECVSPNTCQCHETHCGNRCEKECKILDCGEKGSFNKSTEKCDCEPGYVGKFCENICPSGFYGINCNQKCNCTEFTKCDHVLGTCFAENINIKKISQKLNRCNEVCDEGVCNPNTLRCECTPGYTGSTCNISIRCPKNSYREDSFPGCQCNPGWIGENCNEKCKSGTFGKNCTSTCPYNETSCNHITGETENEIDGLSLSRIVCITTSIIVLIAIIFVIIISIYYKSQSAKLNQKLAHNIGNSNFSTLEKITHNFDAKNSRKSKDELKLIHSTFDVNSNYLGKDDILPTYHVYQKIDAKEMKNKGRS